MMASAGSVSPAVAAAQLRRDEQQVNTGVRIDWFIREVSDKVEMTLIHRMKIVVDYIRSKCIRNISRPVTKTVVSRLNRQTGKMQSSTVVSNRSKPMEYPKADTTLLMRTIFIEVRTRKDGMIDGFVGTPLEYGIFLELKMNRRFLSRTLFEEKARITKILLGPIKE